MSTEQDSVWQRRYARVEQVVTRLIAGETILVPIKGKVADMQKLFTLNEVGQYIWRHLDGTMDLASIRTALLQRFEVEPETLEQDLLDFIRELSEAGLISEV